MSGMQTSSELDALDGPLASLDRARVWLNSQPLTAEGLRGRVVAVDFWTYSCVNWLRTLPYVRAWAERYAGQGLVVVGAHAPEFGFEHDLGNVKRATAALGVGYPVVIDNEFAIWRAFGNRYWPALYLVDQDGRVRFHHFGEDAYDEIERAIQKALGADEDLTSVEAGGLSEPADWGRLGSPETYLGSARGERGTVRAPDDLRLNEWALAGQWAVDEESAVLELAGGSIAYRFESRDVNLVMTPPSGSEARFTVRLDGEPPGDDHGLDTDPSGAGVLSEPRMYQLVRISQRVLPRTIEITFRDAGAAAYVFTFG